MWVIINLSQCRDARERSGFYLHHGYEPTFIHESVDRAREELLRLQSEDPGGEFVMFQAVERALPTRSNCEVYVIGPVPS